MKNIIKSDEEDADTSSSLSRLPDEIILQILNKLSDLKFLCSCYLVSRRFSSIVLQVDAISFAVPLFKTIIPDTNNVGNVDGDRFPKKLLRFLIKRLHCLRGKTVAPSRPHPSVITSFDRESFRSACKFLSKFTEVKSLSLELAFTRHGAMENRFLLNWKFIMLDKGIQSLIVLSPNSICDADGFPLNGKSGGEDDEHKRNIMTQCFRDVITWHTILMSIVMRSPKLEEISITDSGRRGRLSLNAEDLGVVKEWLRLSTEIVRSQTTSFHIDLNLPKSGYVMKQVTAFVMMIGDLRGATEVVMKSNDSLKDKEEAVYDEAVMEIFEEYMGMKIRVL